jgi:hypothetical protein
MFISLSLASSATTAYSCSCDFWKAQKKLHKAQVVFVGEVVEITTNNDKEPSHSVSIKFTIDRYWKGIKEPYITVVSAPAVCCTCGLAVKIGVRFLIYGFRLENGELETSLCTSEALDSEVAAEQLKALGRAKVLKRRR